MNGMALTFEKTIKYLAPFARGVGIDIEDVGRFRRQDIERNPEFYQKIFTEHEISYCLSKPDPYPHFTARFAAKEAVAKTLGKTMYELKDIEIRNDKTGRPAVSVRSDTGLSILVSLSHTKDIAAAIALWEAKDGIEKEEI